MITRVFERLNLGGIKARERERLVDDVDVCVSGLAADNKATRIKVTVEVERKGETE